MVKKWVLGLWRCLQHQVHPEKEIPNHPWALNPLFLEPSTPEINAQGQLRFFLVRSLGPGGCKLVKAEFWAYVDPRVPDDPQKKIAAFFEGPFHIPESSSGLKGGSLGYGNFFFARSFGCGEGEGWVIHGGHPGPVSSCHLMSLGTWCASLWLTMHLICEGVNNEMKCDAIIDGSKMGINDESCSLVGFLSEGWYAEIACWHGDRCLKRMYYRLHTSDEAFHVALCVAGLKLGSISDGLFFPFYGLFGGSLAARNVCSRDAPCLMRISKQMTPAYFVKRIFPRFALGC